MQYAMLYIVLYSSKFLFCGSENYSIVINLYGLQYNIHVYEN